MSKIMLAPMEGVTDYHMRELLTAVGGYDRCVTEFLRVTDHLYPDRVFYRSCPELHHGGVTKSGTPVYVQLLGSDDRALAANAVRAVQLGAVGIDLNFGCPAKTVNRHGGGSALLRTPCRVAQIVATVREAVPCAIPVTAKIRLGFDDSHSLLQISRGIVAAGATELCVHARTRLNGYKPPAFWQEVWQVHQHSPIPVTINGEIWSVTEADRARAQSGCRQIMLGRGALSRPDLGRLIRAHLKGQTLLPMVWSEVLLLLRKLLDSAEDLPQKYAGNRTKQWLTYLRRSYPQAAALFEQVKRERSVEQIAVVFDLHGKSLVPGNPDLQ